MAKPHPKRKPPRSAWKKGRSGNPGGQTKEHVAARQELLAIFMEHGVNVAKAMVANALRGNPQAQKTIVEYILGEPRQLVELIGANAASEISVKIELPCAPSVKAP